MDAVSREPRIAARSGARAVGHDTAHRPGNSGARSVAVERDPARARATRFAAGRVAPHR